MLIDATEERERCASVVLCGWKREKYMSVVSVKVPMCRSDELRWRMVLILRP